MDSLFKSLADPAWALLRIFAGAMFAMHGAQSLFDILGNERGVPPAGSQMWIGKGIEFTTGILVAVGCFTRPAAFLASGTMAVAFWQFHFAAGKPLPIQNGGEMAVLYCFIFLAIAGKGAGRFAMHRS